jgi:hypothetical protein
VRKGITDEFRAKTISKEVFRLRNAEIALEWRELNEEEREGSKVEEIGPSKEKGKGDEEKVTEGRDDEEVDGLPVIRTRKRKVAEPVEDEEGEEDIDELEEGTTGGGRKWAKREDKGLLVFEGPVSYIQYFSHLLI